MSELEYFYRLKQDILKQYQKHYPYYQRTIHNFGNSEIAQLLDLVEKECNERVSEKWVYTHLKPKVNEKLPRKDMLAIFSRWLGYQDWDAYKYENKDPILNDDKNEGSNIKKNTRLMWHIGAGVIAVIMAIGIGFSAQNNEATICLKDKYTQKHISAERISLYVLQNSIKEKLITKDRCFYISSKHEDVQLIAESPYYKTDTLYVNFERTVYEYDLQPDDYAMMLRAYMNADVDDWNRRKEQLNNIIDNDAIIQEIMFDDIGVEFLNKQDFINKITTPSKLVKKMEIVEIEYKAEKIISIKYIQK